MITTNRDRIVELTEKIAIALIVINFMTGIFYAFTGNGLTVNNPNNSGLQTLSGLQATISQNSNSLVGSFSAKILNQNSSCLFSGCPLNTIGNFIYDIGIFIISLLVLVATSFGVVLTLVFAVIPQLFINGAFGVFDYIAVSIYGVLVIVLGVYGLSLINQMYRDWIR